MKTLTLNFTSGLTITVEQPLGICPQCLADPTCRVIEPILAIYCVHNRAGAMLQAAALGWAVHHPVTREAFVVGLAMAKRNLQQTEPVPGGSRH